MSVSSFRFLFFVAAVFLLYFILPKKLRWMLLLAASCAFYALADIRCFVFLALTALSVYFTALIQQRLGTARDAALALARDREEKKALRASYKKRKRRALAATLIFNFGILVVLKYTGFLFLVLNRPMPYFGFLSDPSAPRLLLPLGISFYTFQATGYLIDVYNGKTAAERNFARFALFVSFFPQVVQGPISRFEQLSGQLYEPHGFDYDRFKYGMELILWGYLKKLVVADNIFPFVMGIVSKWDKFSGTAILLAMLFYSLALYADFSGGIDISRGICQVLGIELTPNFRQPFFSKSLSEFWRRWHITLGGWFRDYVFYPLATSKLYLRLGQKLRGRLGQTAAERVCTSLVSLFTFLLIGIWHGAAWGYVLYGLWHGCIIAASTLLADVLPRFLKKLHIRSEAFGWKLFQMARTYLLVLTGFYLVLPPRVTDAFGMLAKTVTDQEISLKPLYRLLIKTHFFKEFPLVLMCAFIMVIVSVLSANGRDVRRDLNKTPLAVQWLVLLAGVILVFTFGCYGPGYDATSFIYQVF